MNGSIFVVASASEFIYYNTLVLINSDTLNLLKIFKIVDIDYSYFGVLQSNKAFIVNGKLSFIFPNGMNYYLTYFNDDMTINKTESIYKVLYFYSNYISGRSLYKYANNTLYLAAKRDYKINDASFNYVTAITKFDIQYQSDEWDNRVFGEILSTDVSNLQAWIV